MGRAQPDLLPAIEDEDDHDAGHPTASSPLTARPVIIRWISDVPSEMVSILERGAVSAG
jgi:hypothetical protein